MPLPHLLTSTDDEATDPALAQAPPPLSPGAATALLAIVRNVRQRSLTRNDTVELPDEAA